MLSYRLTVFDAAARCEASLAFEAESDRDAVRLSNAAAAGHAGALWRDGRLLLNLERIEADQLPSACWAESEPDHAFAGRA
jgi:hypothetical protein